MDADADFDAFVNARGLALTRFALALTGDRHEAEDLVQSALLKAYRHWGRVVRADHPEAYVRRIVLTSHLDESRRRRLRLFRERPVAELPEPRQVRADHADAVCRADELGRALRELTAQQRAVLVLRHYAGLDDAAIAAELGCSEVTVRSHASRGAAQLRGVLGTADHAARTHDHAHESTTGGRA